MATGRIVTPDLMRGIAVLGILAVNIAGYAGPVAATLSPHLPRPGTFADEAWFAFILLVFEGKMRALLSLVFGASMLLALDRADEEGPGGEALQLRRLGWLAVIGYLHYLLWWGDILFTYALAAMAALAFRQVSARALAIGAFALFASWHLSMAPDGIARARAEHAVLDGTATPAQIASYAAERRASAATTAAEMAATRQGVLAQAAAKLRNTPAQPLSAALGTMGETLPLMLLGMALYRAGFFTGGWSPATLRRMAIAGIATGGLLTAGFIALAWSRHFPPVLMLQGLAFLLAIPHLLMALGYAALVQRAAPRLGGGRATSRAGRALADAGRMALSNYVGTTLVMTFCFYGWGLGLMGRVPPHWLWPFVLGGWAAMLAASSAWLARFRLGPLEWLWRSLAAWQRQPLRRAPRQRPAAMPNPS